MAWARANGKYFNISRLRQPVRCAHERHRSTTEGESKNCVPAPPSRPLASPGYRHPRTGKQFKNPAAVIGGPIRPCLLRGSTPSRPRTVLADRLLARARMLLGVTVADDGHAEPDHLAAAGPAGRVDEPGQRRTNPLGFVERHGEKPMVRDRRRRCRGRRRGGRREPSAPSRCCALCSTMRPACAAGTARSRSATCSRTAGCARLPGPQQRQLLAEAKRAAEASRRDPPRARLLSFVRPPACPPGRRGMRDFGRARCARLLRRSTFRARGDPRSSGNGKREGLRSSRR